jgi:chromosome segregation ATPase
MKNLISLATITTTVICTLTTSTAIAAIKCQPLVKDMKAQELLVSDFSYQVNKIEKKLARIESKILEKNNSISVIQSEIDSEKYVIQQKDSDKLSLIDSIQSLEDEKSIVQSTNNSLQNRISSLLVDIEHLPTRSNARRQALREKKRTELKIKANLSKIDLLDDQMYPVIESINHIIGSIENSQAKVLALKDEKRNIKQAAPTMKSLKERKIIEENKLYGQESIQESNLVILADLTEKVDMCKTFKVKYPLSLKIAKEVYEVGCDQYVTKGFQGKYKQDAESETLAKICSSAH